MYIMSVFRTANCILLSISLLIRGVPSNSSTLDLYYVCMYMFTDPSECAWDPVLFAGHTRLLCSRLFQKGRGFCCECSSQIVGCFHFNSLFSSSRMSLVSWGYRSSCPGSRLSPSPWHGLQSCTAPWLPRTLNMTSSVPCANLDLLYRGLG